MMYWTNYIEKDGKLIIQIWNDDELECEWEGTEEQLCDLVLDTKESQ